MAMLNEEVASKIANALGILAERWREIDESDESKEIERQYNILINALLDCGFDPYRDYLDLMEMLPARLMPKRYLIAAKEPIPPDHKSY